MGAVEVAREVDPRRAVLSWSGGKDSALALHEITMSGSKVVAGLLTTVTSTYDRISMHGVRTDLLRAQAQALGLPLIQVRIPAACSNEQYESALREQLLELRASGVEDMIFGDLFLQDVRNYRERQLEAFGMVGHFPLWGRDTRTLAEQFIALGFRAILVCVDPKQIDARFCGREFDLRLLEDLPESCDPCGERGEFHTFVYDAPLFNRPVALQRGEIVLREGFAFCDLAPAEPARKKQTRI